MRAEMAASGSTFVWHSLRSDGVTVLMQYSGIGVPNGAGMGIRIAPQFETGDARYAWLNNVQAVGIGIFADGQTRNEIYALR
jgi:hypothetical protein